MANSEETLVLICDCKIQNIGKLPDQPETVAQDSMQLRLDHWARRRLQSSTKLMTKCSSVADPHLPSCSAELLGLGSARLSSW